MSITTKKTKTSKRTSSHSSLKKSITIEVSDKVGNYEKHPFFVKKAYEMKELLKKVGLPKFDRNVYRQTVKFEKEGVVWTS